MRIIPTTAASGSRNRLVPLNAEENPRSTGWDEALERGFCAAPGRDAAVYGGGYAPLVTRKLMMELMGAAAIAASVWPRLPTLVMLPPVPPAAVW